MEDLTVGEMVRRGVAHAGTVTGELSALRRPFRKQRKSPPGTIKSPDNERREIKEEALDSMRKGGWG